MSHAVPKLSARKNTHATQTMLKVITRATMRRRRVFAGST